MQNSQCVAYGSTGAGNLRVADHISKHKDIRLLQCRTCKERFSERKGTLFYRSHTPLDKAELHHAGDRLLRVKEDSVIRYTRLGLLRRVKE